MQGVQVLRGDPLASDARGGRPRQAMAPDGPAAHSAGSAWITALLVGAELAAQGAR